MTHVLGDINGGDMTDSILNSIKGLLYIDESEKGFDSDIIMHINSVFMVLNQLGVGPDEGFTICDDSATWSDFLGDYVDKQVRDAIGLNKKDPLTKSQKLAQDAKDAANKKVIAQVEDYFKERDKGKNPATDTKKNSGYTMTEAQKKEHDALFGNHETKTESDAEKRKREHNKLFSGRY